MAQKDDHSVSFEEENNNKQPELPVQQAAPESDSVPLIAEGPRAMKEEPSVLANLAQPFELGTFQRSTEGIPSKSIAAKSFGSFHNGPKGAKRGRKKGRANKVTFAYYIHKVLKQVHPDCKISSRAMSIMDSMMKDILGMVAEQSLKLTEYTNRNTLTSREVQTSARLLFPGELAKHALSEGSKAVTKYTNSFKE